MAPPPPASGRARALPPEQRRSAIVAATVPLLAEHGERITTRQIAKAAGVAEGTIFGVFADKNEVLSAALEAALDMGTLEERLALIDPDLPFEDQVVEAIKAIQQRLADVWHLVSNLSPTLQRQARRPFRPSQAMIQLFERHDRLTMEPAEAARLLRALVISMNHPLVGGKRTKAADIAEVFLYGVSATPRSNPGVAQ